MVVIKHFGHISHDMSVGCRWMSNVSLHTFTLGDIPPRVFGIKVATCSP